MKILIVDIELGPLLVHAWQLFDVTVGLNQIVKDWHLLSFAAKWTDSKEVIYADQSKEKDVSNDKKLCAKLWKLLDEADIVIGQNSKKFDIKKINARLIINGFPPPSSYRQIDTLQISKKLFAFTSNKLAYTSENLNTKYKKLEHKKYPGHELWTECLKGNKDAWRHMKKYNCYDVLATEEKYNRLKAWDSAVNFNVYSDEKITRCNCGSVDFYQNGYMYSSTGKYKRFRCKSCGAEARDRKSSLSKEKKKSLKRLQFKK